MDGNLKSKNKERMLFQKKQTDYAKAVAAYLVDSQVPLYGKVIHTAVPAAGIIKNLVGGLILLESRKKLGF